MGSRAAWVEWADRFQVPLYLAAIVIGSLTGLLLPVVAGPAGVAIDPSLGLLLYATFLAVPFRQIENAIRDWRFLTTVLTVNFAVVPVVVWVLSRIVAHDKPLLIGVLFVLLAPCVDYVIVFTGLAGGAKVRLLAAAPLLMVAQMILLPVYLRLFVGAEIARMIDLGPFVSAFVFLIALPLAAAVLTQIAAARTRWAQVFAESLLSAMVPLMMLTLAVTVASQIGGVTAHLGSLLAGILVFFLFAVVMVPLGAAAGRVARLDVAAQRAVVFSGVTRNSLVVLPLVLALPPAFDLAPIVVVTQTLVELIVMVTLIRIVPRVIRSRSPAADCSAAP